MGQWREDDSVWYDWNRAFLVHKAEPYLLELHSSESCLNLQNRPKVCEKGIKIRVCTGDFCMFPLFFFFKLFFLHLLMYYVSVHMCIHQHACRGHWKLGSHLPPCWFWGMNSGVLKLGCKHPFCWAILPALLPVFVHFPIFCNSHVLPKISKGYLCKNTV